MTSATPINIRLPDFSFIPTGRPKQRPQIYPREVEYFNWLLQETKKCWDKLGIMLSEQEAQKLIRIAVVSLVKSMPPRLERLAAWGLLDQNDAQALVSRNKSINTEKIAKMIVWFVGEHLTEKPDAAGNLNALLKNFQPHQYFEYLCKKFEKLDLPRIYITEIAKRNPVNAEAAIERAISDLAALEKEFKDLPHYVFLRAVYSHPSRPREVLSDAIKKADELYEKHKDKGLTRAAALQQATRFLSDIDVVVDTACTQKSSLAKEAGATEADAKQYLLMHRESGEALKKAIQERDRLLTKYKGHRVPKSSIWEIVKRDSDPEQEIIKLLKIKKRLLRMFKKSGLTAAFAWYYAFKYSSEAPQALKEDYRERAELAKEFAPRRITEADAFYFIFNYRHKQREKLKAALDLRDELVKEFKDQGMTVSRAWYLAVRHPSNAKEKNKISAERGSQLAKEFNLSPTDSFWFAVKYSDIEKARKVIRQGIKLHDEFRERGITRWWAIYFVREHSFPQSELIRAVNTRDRLAAAYSLPKSSAMYFAACVRNPDKKLAHLKVATEEIAEKKNVPSAKIWETVSANLGLVGYWANKFQGRGLEYEDLFQEGTLGLLRAVELFDPERGAALSTYASYWIKAFIQLAIENQGRTIRVPVHKHALNQKIISVRAKLSAEFGRPATEKEIAANLEISEEDLVKTETQMKRALSLDQPVKEDAPLSQFVPSHGFPDPEEAAIRSEELKLEKNLADRIDTLPPKLAFVLREYYGLISGEPKTLEEVGKMLTPPITREGVRQNIVKAIKLLKRRLIKMAPAVSLPPQNELITNIDKLSPKMALVLKERFGLSDGIPKTLEEVGKLLDPPESRRRVILILQIEAIKILIRRFPKVKDSVEELKKLLRD